MLVWSSIRSCLLLATLLMVTPQSLLIGMSLSEEGNINVEHLELDLVEKDILAIYLSPGVENISVRCQPLRRGGSYDLSISTRYLSPYLEEASAVWVQPNLPGIYNLTINFVGNGSWKYVVGVYTGKQGFYEEYYGKRINIQGSFVELQPALIRHPGNWTINAILKIHSLSPSSPYFVLPTPVNSAMLIAVIGLIAYIDSFVLLDTYFKSKKESISNSRWILVGLMLLISAYAAYQIYDFTVFSQGGG